MREAAHPEEDALGEVLTLRMIPEVPGSLHVIILVLKTSSVSPG